MYELLFEEQFTVFEMLLIQSPLIFHSSLLNVEIKSLFFRDISTKQILKYIIDRTKICLLLYLLNQLTILIFYHYNHYNIYYVF